MSAGFTEWKAPEQTKRMWSVFTLPCLVWTVEPVCVCRVYKRVRMRVQAHVYAH